MKKVKIGNNMIGEGESCLISFEPSATYNDLKDAKEMIRYSALAGADAVKFQTFFTNDSDRIMGKKDSLVNFATSSGKKQELVYDALKRRELSKEDWTELVKYAKELKINFITAPYFPETVKFLEEIKVDALKVSKGDINNVLLIEDMAKTNLPVILDAREKFQDVENAIKICEKVRNENIIIMHCPSGYPAENSGVHLRSIKAIQEKYGYPVGFADHSPGDIMNHAAVAMGAAMLEKTITFDKTTEHVEHYMSLEVNELKKFVEDIRSIEAAMGDPKILMTSRVEESARRSLVTKSKIAKGSKITRELLDYKRPGNAGISCADANSVIGKTASRSIPEDTFLQWDMLT